jgi:small subunit ribosomal protein S1
MSDNIVNENNGENEKSFATLLDSYSPVASTDIRIGDKVRGQIISIGKDTVFVDTNNKIDGIVDKAEFLDEN